MQHLPELVLFVVIASITPGPNNIMIMASGVNFGWQRSLPHMAGICLGVPSLLVALGLGAGYLFEQYPSLHQLIKALGLGYLLYLAWRIATATPSTHVSNQSQPLKFWEAALFQWVNPKLWVMGASALATFTTVGANMSVQVAVVVLVFFILAWTAVGIWLFFGTKLKTVLANPRQQQIFNITMAILLLLSMAGVVIELIDSVRH